MNLNATHFQEDNCLCTSKSLKMSVFTKNVKYFMLTFRLLLQWQFTSSSVFWYWVGVTWLLTVKQTWFPHLHSKTTFTAKITAVGPSKSWYLPIRMHGIKNISINVVVNKNNNHIFDHRILTVFRLPSTHGWSGSIICVVRL